MNNKNIINKFDLNWSTTFSYMYFSQDFCGPIYYVKFCFANTRIGIFLRLSNLATCVAKMPIFHQKLIFPNGLGPGSESSNFLSTHFFQLSFTDLTYLFGMGDEPRLLCFDFFLFSLALRWATIASQLLIKLTLSSNLTRLQKEERFIRIIFITFNHQS